MNTQKVMFKLINEHYLIVVYAYGNGHLFLLYDMLTFD